jgi:hypothetical protein
MARPTEVGTISPTGTSVVGEPEAAALGDEGPTRGVEAQRVRWCRAEYHDAAFEDCPEIKRGMGPRRHSLSFLGIDRAPASLFTTMMRRWRGRARLKHGISEPPDGDTG